MAEENLLQNQKNRNKKHTNFVYISLIPKYQNCSIYGHYMVTMVMRNSYTYKLLFEYIIIISYALCVSLLLHQKTESESKKVKNLHSQSYLIPLSIYIGNNHTVEKMNTTRIKGN